MPRVYEMSWDGKKCRWVKMHKGKRYSIACSVLNTPPTKEGSYQAANEWWKHKELELRNAAVVAPLRTPQPLEDLTEAVYGAGLFGSWKMLLTHAGKFPPPLQDLLHRVLQERADLPLQERPSIDSLPHQELAEALRRYTAADVLLPLLLHGEQMPTYVQEALPVARVQELEDAARSIRGEAVAPHGESCQEQAQAWMDSQKNDVHTGEMTAARWANVKFQLAHFINFVGPTVHVNTINESKLSAYADFVKAKVGAKRNGEEGWSSATARENFSTIRRWVRWLWSTGQIELPRNIEARVRFGSTLPIPKTWTIGEVHTVLGEASERMKLFLLLMLNIGATQIDITKLQDTEVDWTAGRVTRRRSKTNDKEKTPIVCYQLWPETFRLLQKYRSNKANVLLSERGKLLVKAVLKDDKAPRVDLIATGFSQLQKRIGFKKPLKQLRKTSSSLLEEHEVYGRYAQYFLGQAPKSIAERHYIQPSQKLFDDAVSWLGKQLGFA